MKKQHKILLFALLCILLATATVSAQTAYGEPIERDDYTISRSIVVRQVTQGSIFEDSLTITNNGNARLTVSLAATEGLTTIIDFESSGIVVEAQNQTEAKFTIIGTEVRDYTGEIALSGDIVENIPTNITVTNESIYQELILEVNPTKKSFTTKEEVQVKINVNKILPREIKNATFTYTLRDLNNTVTFPLGAEIRDIPGSFQIKKDFTLPPDVEKGEYVLDILTEYGLNKTIEGSAAFTLRIPFFRIKLFGLIPVWLIFLIAGLALFAGLAYFIIKREINKRKKYKMQLLTKTLPKKDERTILLGKVAEKNIPAYYEIDRLTTHGVVAGATGGGKSISAQVIIEEMLLKNIAVIVFDPTAQWSGMLRKCEDKKMMSFYQKFGLKPTDAKAFPGNVRQIKDARQVIDIEKHTQPGQIQIFTLNKLDPQDMDIFVANVIASIFRSDPKEHPVLRTILVFDEVHRLLPKFGGSGKGFLQIERACREFRKWGYGVMLVSQVLSDFVGEIKANINTEVQMRTRDESDLNRLKTKYGEEVLQSLIKASVGVGMFVNPAYNKGKPYFINFRPILHSTRRLSDEVLDKYNKYGEIIDDLEYQIEQLEELKVDTFDLKMELKLVKDKLMTGNFTVVDIYLEGLTPRITKQWETLGKKPKKKELELLDQKEVDKSLAAAEKERKAWDNESKGGEKKAPEGQPAENKEAAPAKEPPAESESKEEKPPAPDESDKKEEKKE